VLAHVVARPPAFAHAGRGQDDQATAIRALAAGAGRDIAAQKQIVGVTDNALRGAINAALGHGALDAINVGQMQQLTSLNAAGLDITDLTGLQYATSLTSLDLRNNNISSFAPVAGLTGTTILEDGNPGYAGGDGDVPTLPEWGMILLGSLLLFTMMRSQRRPV
jgi:Leucine-rich repeat (LRR) protein